MLIQLPSSLKKNDFSISQPLGRFFFPISNPPFLNPQHPSGPKPHRDGPKASSLLPKKEPVNTCQPFGRILERLIQLLLIKSLRSLRIHWVLGIFYPTILWLILWKNSCVFFSWPLKIHQLRTSQEKRGLFDSVFFRRVRNWDLQISSFFRSYDYLGNIQITYLEKVANYEEIDMLVSSGLKSNEVQERNLILSGNPIGSGTYI